MSKHSLRGVAYTTLFIMILAAVTIYFAAWSVRGMVDSSAETRMFYGIADTTNALRDVCEGKILEEVPISVPRNKMILIYDCNTIQDGISVWPGFDEGNPSFKKSVKAMQDKCDSGSKGVLIARSWHETEGSWFWKKEIYSYAGEVHHCSAGALAGVTLGPGEHKLVIMRFEGGVLVTYGI